MPCSDEYSCEREEKHNVTAMLCALLVEINKLDDGFKIIQRAEINGKVSIRPFMVEHEREDISRLIGKLSKHEIDLIKRHG